MRKLLILLLFFLMFFAGDRLISKFLINVASFSSLPFPKLYSGKAISDILILGDSRAYHHLNEKDWAEEIKMSVLSVSSTGAPLIFQEIILEDYIKIYGKPKVVVIELNSLISSFDQILSVKYIGLFSENFKNLLSTYFFKYYFFSELFNLFYLNSINFLNVLHKSFVSYSQPKLLGQIDFQEIQNIEKSKYQKYFVNKHYNVDSLKRIIFRHQDDIKFIYIITPIHESVLKKQIEKNLWINNLSKIIPNSSSLYDYSNSIISDQYFFDDRHLNDKGVKKLFNIMKKDNFFKELM